VPLSDLEPLAGEWRLEPLGGSVSFAWLGDGAFLVQRWSSDLPEYPDGIAVFGEDAEGGGLVQHYFDSRGVARRYGTSLEDGVWRLWRDDPDFAQRFAGELGDGGATIAGAWEIRHPGGEWEPDFDLRFVRVG
jgi:hypothetical protein